MTLVGRFDNQRVPPADIDEVLAAALAGDASAFAQLWRVLSPSVTGYLRMRGVGEPEDATSEVFLNVFRGLRSFRGNEAAFRSWVFTIAHRRSVDDQRKRARGPSTTPYQPDDDPRVVPGAEQDALDAWATERVTRLLAQLTPDQRDVLLLRVVADLSLEQVAAVLGRRVGAVKALQHRGLTALRRNLEGVSR